MKKIIYIVILIVFSVFISSCSKDNPVSPGGGSQATNYQYIQYSNYHPVILNNGYTYDSINCIVPTDSIGEASLVRNINLVIDTSFLDATKLTIEINHTNKYGVEFYTTVLTGLTNPGTLIGTVLTDSSATPIASGNTTYTGRFKPTNPLNYYTNATPSGNWKIRIYYTGADKGGVIKSWSVGITYNSIQQPQPTAQLLPFFVGNYWVYTNDTLTNAIWDTLFTPDYRYIHGNMTYKWIWGRYHRLSDPNFYWCSNNDNLGLRGYGNYYDSSMSPLLWFKYPDYIGDTNITKYWLNGLSIYNDTIVCIDDNATVSTPVGVFTGCMAYKENSSSWKSSQFNKGAFGNDNTLGTPTTYIYYFKSGIGLLGQDEITPTARYYLRLSYHRVQ